MIVRVCSIESPRSTAAATLSSGDTVALERRPTRPASEGSDGSEPPKALDPRSSLSSIAIAIGDVICEGGMGVVRTAIQRSLARTVAIKTTFPDATAKEAERMLQEAWVTGFLEHPGVVPVHDILRGEDGAPVVVMRRIRGATWEQRRDDAEWARAQGARDLLEQNLRIFVRVCEVVEFAHAKGVIHRDIKPANVMLGSFGEVYLLDWGLALAIGEEAAQHLPRAGLSRELTGTLAYAAPEMIGAIDVPLAEHTDVYLLGAVLFELATGRPPHDKPTVTLTFESIASSPALGARGRSGPPRSDLRARHGEATTPSTSSPRPSAPSNRCAPSATAAVRDGESTISTASAALPSTKRCTCGRRTRRRGRGSRSPPRSSSSVRSSAIHAWRWRSSTRRPTSAPELVARVRSAAAAEASERDGLSRLARVHDQHTGLRARQVFFILLGLSWTASQFADRYGPLTHRRFALSSLVELPLLGLAWLISRDMMRTLFNRRMLGAVALMLVAQSIFFLCAGALDVPIVTARTLQLGLWATVAASLTLFLERRFWPMTLCMVCALATTVRWPDHRAVAGAVSSAAVTVNLAMMWRRKPSR